MLANRFRTGSLVSATSWRLFRASEQVSNRIALSWHVVIVLAGSRQVCCVSVVLARLTLENNQTYEPVRHFFDAVIYLFCVITLYLRRQLRLFFRARFQPHFLRCRRRSVQNPRKSMFSITPLSFNAPSPENPCEYPHKLYVARN